MWRFSLGPTFASDLTGQFIFSTAHPSFLLASTFPFLHQAHPPSRSLSRDPDHLPPSRWSALTTKFRLSKGTPLDHRIASAHLHCSPPAAMTSPSTHTANAIAAITNRSKVEIPEIDFTQHQLENGDMVSTTERVVKDVRAVPPSTTKSRARDTTILLGCC